MTPLKLFFTNANIYKATNDILVAHVNYPKLQQMHSQNERDASKSAYGASSLTMGKAEGSAYCLMTLMTGLVVQGA